MEDINGLPTNEVQALAQKRFLYDAIQTPFAYTGQKIVDNFGNMRQRTRQILMRKSTIVLAQRRLNNPYSQQYNSRGSLWESSFRCS